jgi:hypothetical protein
MGHLQVLQIIWTTTTKIYIFFPFIFINSNSKQQLIVSIASFVTCDLQGTVSDACFATLNTIVCLALVK